MYNFQLQQQQYNEVCKPEIRFHVYVHTHLPKHEEMMHEWRIGYSGWDEDSRWDEVVRGEGEGEWCVKRLSVLRRTSMLKLKLGEFM